MSQPSDNLRDVGLKATLPRIRVLQLLEQAAQTNNHLSAEDIYKQLIKTQKNVSLATVYRVLTQFEAAGLVIKHQFKNDHSVFEMVTDDHHDHMVCLETGKIIEFCDPVIEQHQHDLANKHGFDLVDHRLVLYVKPRQP